MPNQETPASKWRRLSYLLPLLVPTVVFLTFIVFYGLFLFCSPTNPCTPLSESEILAGISNLDQIRVAAYVARASWTLINGVHVLACLTAIVTAALVIYQALPEAQYPPRRRLMMIFIVIAAAVDISVAVAIWVTGDVSSPAQTLLRATVSQVRKFERLLVLSTASANIKDGNAITLAIPGAQRDEFALAITGADLLVTRRIGK